MTQDELKLVLDALKECNIYAFAGGLGVQATAHRDALAILEKALAQHDSVQAKPEPEQESVADDFFRMIADRNPKPFPPPQRGWVGMTDEEIAQAIESINMLWGMQLKLLMPLKAKLKDKNS